MYEGGTFFERILRNFFLNCTGNLDIFVSRDTWLFSFDLENYELYFWNDLNLLNYCISYGITLNLSQVSVLLILWSKICDSILHKIPWINRFSKVVGYMTKRVFRACC